MFNDSGGFLSCNEFKEKYVDTSFLQHHQVISAVPNMSKLKAFQQYGAQIHLH